MVDEHHTPQDSWWIPATRPGIDRPRGIGAWFRSRMVTGLLVAFPLAVTLFFARFLFNLLDRWSYPISSYLFGRPVPGIGAALALILVFVLGMLSHSVVGRRLLRFGEKLVDRVPVVRAVYGGAREITRAFGSDSSRNFRRVVLVPYPHAEVRSIAFLTGEFDLETVTGSERVVTVFMPTTPNPTTGFYMMFPVAKVENVNLSVDEAMRLVISGGLLAPEDRRLLATPHRNPRP
jgi:uncharacterized membrane protein